MTTTPDLLSPEEIELVRDRHDGEVDHEQRVRYLCRVFADLFIRDATLHACLRSYIAGQIKYRGALLLAHRALADKYNRAREILTKYGVKVSMLDVIPQSLESVDEAIVISMARLAEDTVRLAINAQELFGMPAFVGCRLEIRSANEKVTR